MDYISGNKRTPMPTLRFTLFALILLCSTACSKDDPGEDVLLPPSIEITSDKPAGSTVCIGEVVTLEFTFNAPEVIQSLTIERNGTETIADRSDVPVNEFTFSVTYQFNNQDLTNGTVTFFADVVDLNGEMASEDIQFDVVAEFAYTLEDIALTPSFDIANNVPVTTEEGDSVDIFFLRETESCGSFCTYYRYTLVSKNATRFYNIPSQPDVNYTNNRFKQADVESIIAGVEAQTELVMFSTYPEDATATGALNNLPIVIQIRDSGEFAILDADTSNNGDPKLRYRKRTEEAGQ